MPSAVDHGERILGAILPDRVDLLIKAQRVLVPEHFEDSAQAMLYELLSRYFDRVGGVLTLDALEDMSRNIDPGRAQVYIESYRTYQEIAVGNETFEWSLLQLRELASERATLEALVTSREILVQGREVDGELLRGGDAARAFLGTAMAQVERQYTMQMAPEGDVRTEHDEILADYQERASITASGQSRGILTGIGAVDEKTGGFNRGEVILIAGYSSDGKTTMLTQMAWSAAIEQGKNVVFFTTETLRDQVRRKILARHSMHPKFDLAPLGINSDDIKKGTIPASQMASWLQVVNDFTDNPEYGTLYIKQVPRGASLTYIEQSLASLHRKFQVDLVCMDYLALLASERRRGTMREELSQIMKDTKQVATSFAGGTGVPFVSPWQVSRTAREKAAEVGRYTSASLSETSEATNTADVILGMLAPIDNSERIVDLDNLQILKMRDGPTADGLRVQVDYGTSTFRSRASVIATRASTTSSSTLESFLGDT